MTPDTPADPTTIVVGASRGLGRGIATAMADAGTPVIAVARTQTALAELAGGLGDITPEVADATAPTVARTLLDRYDPSTVIVVAGAVPVMRPLQDHTWETFSVNWHTDVQIAFHWLRAILNKPLRPGGRAIVLSSGAAVAGSPLSGGYAGAKATQRLITAYAQEEANRAGRELTFTAVLPRMTPATDLGRTAIAAYAARDGHSQDEVIVRSGAPLTPEGAGAAVLELISKPAASVAPAYLLTGAQGARLTHKGPQRIGATMRLRWLGWAGVEIEAQDEQVVIDPLKDAGVVFAWLGDRLAEMPFPNVVAPRPGAVAGLLTHLHRDHAAALRTGLASGAPVFEPLDYGGEGLERLGCCRPIRS